MESAADPQRGLGTTDARRLITAFAGLPGQAEGDFQPIVDQALYLRNSTKLLAAVAR